MEKQPFLTPKMRFSNLEIRGIILQLSIFNFHRFGGI